MKVLIVVIFFFPFVNSDEREISQQWCNSLGGISEYRTSYGTYVDCLTSEYAIEVEYDYNWKEAIGQSLHYAETTKKNPAILFIKRKSSKKNYLQEMMSTINAFNLPIYVEIIFE